MKDLIEQYNEQNSIPRNYRTVITWADDTDEDDIHFRFESTPELGVLPICQYVRWQQGKGLIYRDKMRWFLPGDICFETFSSAKRYRDNGPQ